MPALMSLDGGSLRQRSTFQLKRWANCSEPVVEQIEIAAKYSGYIDRQKDEVERAAHYENLQAAGRPGLPAGPRAVASRSARS